MKLTDLPIALLTHIVSSLTPVERTVVKATSRALRVAATEADDQWSRSIAMPKQLRGLLPVQMVMVRRLFASKARRLTTPQGRADAYAAEATRLGVLLGLTLTVTAPNRARALRRLPGSSNCSASTELIPRLGADRQRVEASARSAI